MPSPFAPPPVRILSKLKELTKIVPGERYTINRNPRNLERLRIGYKPQGYHLEKPGRNFWHKLELKISTRFVTAQIIHFQNGPVVEASTKEWAINRQLYKTNDTSAYINLARILAQRSLAAGLSEMQCHIKATPDGKMDKFLKTFESEGISLQEPPQYKPDRPWNIHREEKPWEITE